MKCIVPNCIANEFPHSIVTFPFPKITYNKVNPSQPNLVSLRRINLWKKACQLSEDYNIETQEPRVCERHFVSRKPAKKMEMNNTDWVPTINLNGEAEDGELDWEYSDQQEKPKKVSYSQMEINQQEKTNLSQMEINQQENRKFWSKKMEQLESLEPAENVSYEALEEENDNPELCTMIYDEETGDMLIVEPDRIKDGAEEKPQAVKPIQKTPETKTPRKRKDDLGKSVTPKKKPKILNPEAPKEKPKILNPEAPKESDEEPEVSPIETEVTHCQDQACQTDLTMDRIKQMELVWNESVETRSTRRKQKL